MYFATLVDDIRVQISVAAAFRAYFIELFCTSPRLRCGLVYSPGRVEAFARKCAPKRVFRAFLSLLGFPFYQKCAKECLSRIFGRHTVRSSSRKSAPKSAFRAFLSFLERSCAPKDAFPHFWKGSC